MPCVFCFSLNHKLFRRKIVFHAYFLLSNSNLPKFNPVTTYRRDMGGGAPSVGACAGESCLSSSTERCRAAGARTERRRAGVTVLGRRDSVAGVAVPPPFNCRNGSVVTHTRSGIARFRRSQCWRQVSYKGRFIRN